MRLAIAQPCFVSNEIVFKIKRSKDPWTISFGFAILWLSTTPIVDCQGVRRRRFSRIRGKGCVPRLSSTKVWGARKPEENKENKYPSGVHGSCLPRDVACGVSQLCSRMSLTPSRQPRSHSLMARHINSLRFQAESLENQILQQAANLSGRSQAIVPGQNVRFPWLGAA